MNHEQINRREMLRAAAGAAALAAGVLPARASLAAGMPTRQDAASTDRVLPPTADRKLILVLFGGGTRFSESVGDPEHRHVPHLWKELVPRGTLWTNMRVEHRVVHPNCNASIKTGHWEYDDLDWSKPPRHPTIFEIVRKHRNLPDVAAWAFVYASILAQTGRSSAEGYGEPLAANVVEPPTIPRTAAEEMERLMTAARATGSPEAEQEAIQECAAWPARASHIATGGLQCDAARQWLDEQYHGMAAVRRHDQPRRFSGRLRHRPA